MHEVSDFFLYVFIMLLRADFCEFKFFINEMNICGVADETCLLTLSLIIIRLTRVEKQSMNFSINKRLYNIIIIGMIYNINITEINCNV